MATIREVARAAGVSVATASRALNGLSIVTPATREKIEQAAAQLAYVPHSGARNLTRQRTDTIGVILPDLFGEFFSELIRGIDIVTQGAGKTLLLATMHGSTEETGKAIRAMRGRVDGLLVMPPGSAAQTIEPALTRDTPTVLLSARPERGSTPFVSVDNYHGAQLVTEHLIDRGARRIVHVSGPDTNSDARERERGFRDVVAQRLGDTDPLVLPGNFRDDAGAQAARGLIEGDVAFDAVFAANDMMALEMMREFRLAGMEVGVDPMVAGFDDIPLARYVTPDLTTVRTDVQQLGSRAASMMIRMLGGEQLRFADGVVVVPTLAIRGSTAGRTPRA